ncbi:MAPEG family protein [Epibacterium ulvae]|uniref:MAPEG family protein n=1 Tax=Epibacterium ulvae TaxID=1156985 RepID=UPI0024929892|nr:MAPEG family protein [Epibacterium ulvae]
MLSITSFYAGLTALLFVVLSIKVIKLRGRAKVYMGNGQPGEHEPLERSVRVQGNCAEYAPLGLILLALVELQSTPGFVVHILGALLFLGRIAHAVGMGSTPQIAQLRVGGMVMTFLMISLCGLGLIAHAVL